MLINFLKTEYVRRASLVDHFLKREETLAAFCGNTHVELASLGSRPYEAETIDDGGAGKSVLLTGRALLSGSTVAVRKRITPSGRNSFAASYTVSDEDRGVKTEDVMFGVEFNLLLPCCDGPACFYDLGDGVEDRGCHGFATSGETPAVRKFRLVDKHTGLIFSLEADEALTLWRHPVYTVSLSEAGFEKIFQAVCLVLLYPFTAGAGETLRFILTAKVEGF